MNHLCQHWIGTPCRYQRKVTTRFWRVDLFAQFSAVKAAGHGLQSARAAKIAVQKRALDWPSDEPKRLTHSERQMEIKNMRPTQKEHAADPVAHLVAWHDGDHRAAIETLLDDVAHLRMQLALATAAMSAGYTRGWTPDEERDAR